MLSRETRALVVTVAATLFNTSATWACGMNATPAQAPQGPAIQVHVESAQVGRLDTPAILVQTDFLNSASKKNQQTNSNNTLCLLEGDELVGYDIESDPNVVRCKIAADQAQKRLAAAKQRYRKWLNKLPEATREKLQKLEKEDAQNQKDAIRKAVQADRLMTGYFNVDDELRDAEKAFNDPDAKNKPTQKELDAMRENVKESKNALNEAKEKAAQAGEKAEKSEKELKETMSKAFPEKEAEYLNDKGTFEDAQEQADKADAKLKDARAEAMKANRT